MTPAAALLLSLADDHPVDASLTSLLCRRGGATLGVDGTALTAVQPGSGPSGWGPSTCSAGTRERSTPPPTHVHWCSPTPRS